MSEVAQLHGAPNHLTPEPVVQLSLLPAGGV